MSVIRLLYSKAGPVALRSVRVIGSDCNWLGCVPRPCQVTCPTSVVEVHGGCSKVSCRPELRTLVLHAYCVYCARPSSFCKPIVALMPPPATLPYMMSRRCCLSDGRIMTFTLPG